MDYPASRNIKIALVILASLALVGCTKKSVSSPVSGTKTFTHPDYGYTIEYPEEWFLEQTGKIVDIRSFKEMKVDDIKEGGLGGDGCSFQISGKKDNPQRLSSKNWLLSRDKQGVFKSQPSQERQINGMDAFEIIVPSPPQKWIVIGREGWLYQLSWRASPQSRIDQCNPIFENILSSFKVT